MTDRADADLLARRERLMGPNPTTFYDDPVHLVRGLDVWLWDKGGNRYLDCYNNVPHVGHANPRVIGAITQQAGMLNTHTRYIHENILDLIERLTGTMGSGLDRAVMTCTGSESNDIALRMAEAVTGKRGIIATDATYHGNTALVSQLSRSNPPGVGFGLDQFLRFVPAPDSLRPQGGQAGNAHAQAFAASVADAIAQLEEAGHGVAAMILDPFFVNEAFPDLPPGWLAPTVEQVRRAGGLLIADEVQPGFGRIGTHFWGHERAQIRPDIVTMGKPMGNGHPVSAVVTSADVMAAFRETFRYFNTFGGNPVSCAAALAVMDELEDRNLPAQAAEVGDYARSCLRELSAHHDGIADVRGSGMIFGAELVEDTETLTPATDRTARIVNALRHKGILLSSNGRHRNQLKIRPPMTFGREHVDLLIGRLDEALAQEQ